MSDRALTGTTALVTGASRGFGRGIATALTRAGAQVVGVARDRGQLAELREQLGGSFTAVSADAADPVVAGQLIDTYRPAVLVLNAGATPLPRPKPRLAPVTSAVVPVRARSDMMILSGPQIPRRLAGGPQMQTSRTPGNRRGAGQSPGGASRYPTAGSLCSSSPLSSPSLRRIRYAYTLR